MTATGQDDRTVVRRQGLEKPLDQRRLAHSRRAVDENQYRAVLPHSTVGVAQYREMMLPADKVPRGPGCVARRRRNPRPRGPGLERAQDVGRLWPSIEIATEQGGA